jgi:hypothetical protein
MTMEKRFDALLHKMDRLTLTGLKLRSHLCAPAQP